MLDLCIRLSPPHSFRKDIFPLVDTYRRRWLLDILVSCPALSHIPKLVPNGQILMHTSPNLNPPRSLAPSVRHHQQSCFQSTSHNNNPSPFESMDLPISVTSGPRTRVLCHGIPYHGAGNVPMPGAQILLTALEPSMLIGFLCKDKAYWRDFRKRVEKVLLNFCFFVG